MAERWVRVENLVLALQLLTELLSLICVSHAVNPPKPNTWRRLGFRNLESSGIR